MANPSIYRYEVPVGQVQEIALRGPLLPGSVAARQHDRVEFWAIHDPDREPYVERFVVMATGGQINTPQGLLGYVGTAITSDGRLVWHLFTVLALGSRIDPPLVLNIQ